MNSALQPQVLKLEGVFDETVKAGTTIQEELKSAILLRCEGGQLKSYLNLAIGNNVQHSTLRGQVLQRDRSQQKWATSMVASSSADYQGPMPLDVGRAQDAKGNVRRARMTIRKARVKMLRAKERHEKEIRKEKKVIIRLIRAKVKAKISAATCYTCGKPGHLAKDDWRNSIRQVESDQARSFSGPACQCEPTS